MRSFKDRVELNDSWTRRCQHEYTYLMEDLKTDILSSSPLLDTFGSKWSLRLTMKAVLYSCKLSSSKGLGFDVIQGVELICFVNRTERHGVVV